LGSQYEKSCVRHSLVFDGLIMARFALLRPDRGPRDFELNGPTTPRIFGCVHHVGEVLRALLRVVHAVDRVVVVLGVSLKP